MDKRLDYILRNKYPDYYHRMKEDQRHYSPHELEGMNKETLTKAQQDAKEKQQARQEALKEEIKEKSLEILKDKHYYD